MKKLVSILLCLCLALGAAGCKGCAKAKASLALSHCTCCKKRCPLSKPKCGKGRRLAAALKLREKKA